MLMLRISIGATKYRYATVSIRDLGSCSFLVSGTDAWGNLIQEILEVPCLIPSDRLTQRERMHQSHAAE